MGFELRPLVPQAVVLPTEPTLLVSITFFNILDLRLISYNVFDNETKILPYQTLKLTYLFSVQCGQMANLQVVQAGSPLRVCWTNGQGQHDLVHEGTGKIPIR